MRGGDRGARAARVGRDLDEVLAEWATSGAASRSDSQLRWLGPEKGVIHLATAAVVNAVWDLWASATGKPVWRLVADMTPEELVALRRLPLPHRRARRRPRRASCSRPARPAAPRRAEEMERDGYPAYTTSAGWLGYTDDKVRRLAARRSPRAGATSR